MEVVEDAGYIEDFVNVAGDTDTGEAEHNEDPGNNHLRSQHRLEEKKSENGEYKKAQGLLFMKKRCINQYNVLFYSCLFQTDVQIILDHHR